MWIWENSSFLKNVIIIELIKNVKKYFWPWSIVVAVWLVIAPFLLIKFLKLYVKGGLLATIITESYNRPRLPSFIMMLQKVGTVYA